MGVFDGQTKTRRAVADPITDKALPPAGSLPWGAITSPTALPGTSGVDAWLVHGDQWHEITGSLTENFAGNVKTRITQNHNHRVLADQDLHTVGNVTQTTIGNLSSTVMSAESSARLGPVNRLFVAPRVSTWAAPDQIQKSGGTEYESKDEDFENIGTQQQNVGVTIGVFAVKCEAVAALQLGLALFKFDYAGLEGSKCFFEAHEGGAAFQLWGARGEVQGVRGDAAAGQASAANRVNAGPDVGLGTPLR